MAEDISPLLQKRVTEFKKLAENLTVSSEWNGDASSFGSEEICALFQLPVASGGESLRLEGS